MIEKTPRSFIKGHLRQIFLKSKEHSHALKRDGYTCQKCLRKKSQAKEIDDTKQVRKLQVHHINGVKVWDEVIELIYREILCDPSLLQTLCPDCHLEIEGKNKKKVD